jgi:LuxR family maltose regulon positive regulatory protein
VTAIGAAPSRAIGTGSRTRPVGPAVGPPRSESDAFQLPDGIVARDALVDRLVDARDASLVLLVAPAGYGKSTLVAQWAERDPRRFAWLRLSQADNDALELARSIALAVDAGVPELRGVLEGTTKRRRAPDALARALALAFREASDPFVLVLDNGHLLRSRDSLALIERLVDAARPWFQVAIPMRKQPALPMARLRTDRRLFELGARDLVLTRSEIAAVAAAASLELDDAALDLLAERTEGWPGGAYLAALAVRDEPHPARALTAFGGDDKLVVDYVRDEMLADLPGAEIEFLARSSVLARLSGPLCDYVLGRDDSARLLRKLSRMNVLVVPLDRSDTEYRYHALFAEALRSELRLREPGLEPELHARASEWCERHGDRGAAIDHALQADDLERAGTLVWDATPDLLGYGQTERLSRWLGRFGREQIASCAPLALSAACTELAAGNQALADYWRAAADQALQAEPGEPRASVAAALHLLHAIAAARDVATMRSEAALASKLACGDCDWEAPACLVEGMALRLAGDVAEARRRLEEGARRGVAVAPAAQVLCLAQLALLAIDEGDWDGAAARTAIARAQIDRVGLREFPLVALVFAVSAAANAHLSRPEASERDARHADRLLAQLTGFTPWFNAQCRIALAWASVRLSDTTRARRLLDDAAVDLREYPDAVAAQASLAACRESVELASAARSADAEQLTTAELRVLQFLPTHLSFPEIADQLYVSRNTVKTHVRAVYRKLTASSRSEAVQHARQAGLLDRLAA